MSTGLGKLIKIAALDAMNNSQICDWKVGTVKSVSPLRVAITNQLVIPSSLLVVPEHLTDHSIECTISQQSQSTSGETEIAEGLDGESDAIINHTHKFNMTTQGGESLSTVTFHNALQIGDKVALLRKQGGQSYLILDRI